MLEALDRSRVIALVACLFVVTLLASCSQIDEPIRVGDGSGMQVLNATRSAVDVLVDGDPKRVGLGPSLAAAIAPLGPGVHSVALRAPGGARADLLVTTKLGASRTVVVYEASGGIGGAALADTGALVPEGKSKVRVVNLAPSSSIDIWRTQPDFQSPTRFQFPFPYNPEPGPYFQSDAGEWHVWITPTSDWSLKLSEVTLNVPSGGRGTIAVVDSAGFLRLRVLAE
jgi:hypothetical protein